MKHRPVIALGLVGTLLVLTLASCGRQDAVWSDGDGLLRYVPADTPYLFAALEPTPDELFDRMAPWTGSVLESYGTFVEAMINQAATGEVPLPEEELAQIRAIGEVMAEFFSAESWGNAGLTRESLAVLYGRGLLPVLRVTLSDGALFESAIARIETTVNGELPVATLGEWTYRYVEHDDVRVAIAVENDELIVTAAPSSLSDAHLTGVLEGTLPGESIADSGKLRDFAEAYEFAPYQVGFIDFDRLAATFLDRQGGANAELLALFGYDAEALLSQTCRAEFRELANVAPRFVFGSTQIDADEISGKAVLELRSDIAAGLEPIAAALPELGAFGDALYSFGLGFDVAAARDFALARLDAIEADPFQCEHLEGLELVVPEARQTLNSPLPPVVYDINGVVVVLDDITGLDLATGQLPTSVDLRLLLASDDAPALLAMAGLFDPQIGALEIEPNGQPVRVGIPMPIGPIVADPYVALTQRAIAIAIGDEAESRLRALVTAPTGEPLLMSSDLDLRRYYGILGEMMSLGVAQDTTMPPELSEAMVDLMTPLADAPLDRSRAEVRFTERGVEMLSTVTLSD